MPLFRYEVIDKDGKRMFGVMDAATESDVRDRLTSQGYTVNLVLPAGSVQPRPSAQSASQTASPAPTTVPISRLSAPPSEMAVFFRGLASFLTAGVAMHQALMQIAGQSPNRRMRAIAERMAARVQSGERLSEAMTEYPRAFPPHVVGVVAAGELGGFLAIVVADIALDYELAQRASSRVGRIISWILWINTIGLLLTAPAIPLITRGVFSQPDSPTPGTGSMLQLALRALGPYFQFTLKYLVPPLAFLLIAYWAAVVILRRPGLRPLAHSLVLRVPWAGRASRERSLATFSRMLWRLQSAGVLPIQAWDAASRAAENVVLGRRLYGQLDAVRSGEKFSAALAATGLFASEDQRVLSTAEATGQTSDSLRRMAAQYEDAAVVSAGRARLLGVRIAIFATIIATGIAMASSLLYFQELFNGVDKFFGTG